MMRSLRFAGATLAGLVAGGIVIAVVEHLGHSIFPPSPGLDTRDLQKLMATMSRVQAGALVMAVVAWALGAFAGGWVAAALALRASAALVAGAGLLGSGIVIMAT